MIIKRKGIKEMIIKRKLYSINSELFDKFISITSKKGDIILKKSEPLNIFKLAGKVIKSLGKAQKKTVYYDVYLNEEHLGSLMISDGETPLDFYMAWSPEVKNISRVPSESYLPNIVKYFENYARSNKYRTIYLEVSGFDFSLTNDIAKLGYKKSAEDENILIKTI